MMFSMVNVATNSSGRWPRLFRGTGSVNRIHKRIPEIDLPEKIAFIQGRPMWGVSQNPLSSKILATPPPVVEAGDPLILLDVLNVLV